MMLGLNANSDHRGTPSGHRENPRMLPEKRRIARWTLGQRRGPSGACASGVDNGLHPGTIPWQFSGGSLAVPW